METPTQEQIDAAARYIGGTISRSVDAEINHLGHAMDCDVCHAHLAAATKLKAKNKKLRKARKLEAELAANLEADLVEERAALEYLKAHRTGGAGFDAKNDR